MRHYSRSPKPCEFCDKDFLPAKTTSRFCCRKCYKQWRKAQKALGDLVPAEEPPKPAEPPKPLADWIREAKECNLDYGTYRGLINAGKSFDELKALAPSRNPGIHSRSHRSPTYIH